ncbi:hypothetical protein M2124_000305 [Polynucleobacter sphagniphilus]|uniref:hypothetical protein n=1 Tax=Polynucleobacter sphagniphilus TaxID=1743169 RepID=UPI002475A64A|nr:hypothetical protein [Polynucleobacter sphagniphilus]MDH6154049.1 hypothetical protein [Polynucleobacter sphagniphilus]
MLIILTLLFLNSTYNSFAVAMGFQFPYTTFLHNSNDLFGDYFKVIFSYPGADRAVISEGSFLRNYQLHPYGNLTALNQGLVSNIGLTPLSTIISIGTMNVANFFNPMYVYVINIILLLLIMNLFIRENIKSIYIVLLINIAFILSYPVLFAIDRGNILSIINSILIIIFFNKFYTNKIKVSLIFLAIAVNIRPNALILLLVLLLLDDDFKAKAKYLILFLTVALVIAGVSYIFSNILYPDYTFSNFISALKIYRRDYLIGNWGLGYGSSLFGALKFIFGWHSLLEIIAYIISCLGIIFLFYIDSKKKLESYTHAYIVLSIYILSSSVIADYHLAVFFSPILLMLINKTDEVSGVIEWIIIVGSALILGPKNYFFISEVSYQVLLNPLILLISMALIFALKFRNQDFLRT